MENNYMIMDIGFKCNLVHDFKVRLVPELRVYVRWILLIENEHVLKVVGVGTIKIKLYDRI